MSSLGNLDLCRLCLVKDRVSVPIFEGEGDVRQIFLKITACLPVKVNREDKLPKKICDDCVYKVELCYQFWHTTANAEKQLLQWLGEVNMEDKQGYNVLNPNGMKEQNNENRLDGTVMQQVSEHQNNMNMGMMDNMGLSMPIMMSSNAQQQITSVPMDNSGSSVQNVQPVAGPSTQTTHDQITQNQTDTPTQQEEEEESSEEEENSDDECDGDEGLPIKEESEEDPNNSRTIEPTTFVNVSLACDEAGPSGLQQQKIADMPEMVMSQTADVDPKTGGRWTTVRDGDIYRKVIVMHDGVVLQTTARKSVRKRCSPAKGNRKKRMRQRNKKYFSREELCADKEVDEELLNKEEIIEKIKEEIKEEIKSGEMSLSEDTSQNEENKDVDQVLDEVRTACPFCLKHFDHEKLLKRHIVASHQKRAYKCDKCRASCHTKQNLEKHRKSHSDDYFFECDICHLKYKRQITLKQHQVRAHSDVAAEFICDSCGQSFKVKVDLLVHIKRKHSTDIHICRYCGKSVTDLHSHEWKHKKRAEMASLKFSCHLCIKKFQNQTRLDNHLLLHKQGYKCTECSVIVTSSRQLEYHKNRVHKPGTTCLICKKVFVSRGNKFYQHVLTHAGIRPYNCDICGEDFTQRSSLFRHRKNHPGPLPPYTSQVPIAGLAKNVLQKLLKL